MSVLHALAHTAVAWYLKAAWTFFMLLLYSLFLFSVFSLSGGAIVESCSAYH